MPSEPKANPDVLHVDGPTRAIRTRVIAAFPATGKSYVAERVSGVADSDSSQFSWKYNHPDVRERHPDWPSNYAAHVRELLRSDLRYVLVSTHAEVRAALVEHGIPFTLVYPAADLREEYRERMERRGSPPALIDKVIGGLWSDALAACGAQVGCEHLVLQRGQYLADFIESRFPVSAEPRCEDDERFTIYYYPKCGRHKCDPGDMVIHSRDCGGTYGPIEVVRVSAEPSPDPLREALERLLDAVGSACVVHLTDPGPIRLIPDEWRRIEAEAMKAREALVATDQSQRDRTSDEAT